MSVNQTAHTRLDYIDVFRGISVAMMIIVNNQGDWQHVYWALRHARWHGFLGADIVFPFFLFIVGVSISLSFNAALAKGMSKRVLMRKILRRTIILILIGIFINLLPNFEFSSIRIPGVLQRIGLCYGISAFAYLVLSPNGRLAFASALIVLYSCALLFITPDGIGINPLLPTTTICYLVDKALFAGHTYAHAPVDGFDPEGLVSTLGAVVSTMIGFFAFDYLFKEDKYTNGRKHWVRFLTGIGLVTSGLVLSLILPINKNLWTPSFALVTGGIAIIVLATVKFLDDRNKSNACVIPFKWLGFNSLALYLCSSALGKILATFPLSVAPKQVTIKMWIYKSVFLSFASPHAASLAYAVSFLALWIAVAYVLYRNRIAINV
ncbi:MAG: heparan-alpha-glucosaminide N-acetyltransferase domain-containing protein [Spirochaetes bacterium]|nr:heparan-alpha-glucosaminide N-acetyltransferase domain-containing protein [Spirochaetota bacterium]